jgi:hypothetical protein
MKKISKKFVFLVSILLIFSFCWVVNAQDTADLSETWDGYTVDLETGEMSGPDSNNSSGGSGPGEPTGYDPYTGDPVYSSDTDYSGAGAFSGATASGSSGSGFGEPTGYDPYTGDPVYSSSNEYSTTGAKSGGGISFWDSLSGFFGGLEAVRTSVSQFNFSNLDAKWEAGFQVAEKGNAKDNSIGSFFNSMGKASDISNQISKTAEDVYQGALNSGMDKSYAEKESSLVAWGITNDTTGYSSTLKSIEEIVPPGAGNTVFGPNTGASSIPWKEGDAKITISTIPNQFKASGVEVVPIVGGCDSGVCHTIGYDIVRPGYEWTLNGWKETTASIIPPTTPSSSSTVSNPTQEFSYTGTDGKTYNATGSWSDAKDGKQTFTGTVIENGKTTSVTMIRDVQSGNLSVPTTTQTPTGGSLFGFTDNAPVNLDPAILSYINNHKPTSTDPTVKTVWNPNAQTEIIDKGITKANDLAGASMTINGGWTQVVELDKGVNIAIYNSNGQKTGEVVTKEIPLELSKSVPDLRGFSNLEAVLVYGTSTSAKSLGSPVENVHRAANGKIENGAWRVEVTIPANASATKTTTYLVERQFGQLTPGDVSGIPQWELSPKAGETPSQAAARIQQVYGTIQSVNSASGIVAYRAAKGIDPPDYSAIVGKVTEKSALCEKLKEDRLEKAVYMDQSDRAITNAVMKEILGGKAGWWNWTPSLSLMGFPSDPNSLTSEQKSVLNYMVQEKVSLSEAAAAIKNSTGYDFYATKY